MPTFYVLSSTFLRSDDKDTKRNEQMALHEEVVSCRSPLRLHCRQQQLLLTNLEPSEQTVPFVLQLKLVGEQSTLLKRKMSRSGDAAVGM